MVQPGSPRFARPTDAHVTGFLGQRIERCARSLVLGKDEDQLLAGFLRRPGSHPWIGEHVGKWLHAASLLVANQGDPLLDGKARRVVARLLRTQERDGYLGTYREAERWTEWDVWVHKYAVIGLLTWFEVAGDEAALEAATRVADLLRTTFGGAHAGQLVTERVSTHRGMAAGSVLGPIADLYAITKREADLAFAHEILGALESDTGPRILASLREHGSLRHVANAKAYEMLSCLHGFLKLAAIDDALERDVVAACTIAFEDAVATQMHPTGSLSYDEHWVAARPVVGRVSETCVVVTWLQFLEALYAATPDPRIVHVLQRTLVNALLGAQRPDGSAFCYFTPLAGRKPYDPSLHCCGSSGPRGLALAHRWLATQEGDRLVCWAMAPGQAAFEDGRLRMQLGMQGEADFLFGHPNTLVVTNDTDRPVTFQMRVPPVHEGVLELDGTSIAPGEWSHTLAPGATVRKTLRWRLALQKVDAYEPTAHARFHVLGPWVLASDEAFSDGAEEALDHRIAWDQPPFANDLESPPWRTCCFATAGVTGGRFSAVHPTHHTHTPAHATCSAPSRRERSLDGDEPDVSWIAHPDETGEAWFALEWDEPIALRGCVYRHGWEPGSEAGFAVPPVIDVREADASTWREVGAFDGYETNVCSGPPPHPLPQTEYTWTCDVTRVAGLRIRGKACADGVHCAGLLVLEESVPRDRPV